MEPAAPDGRLKGALRASLPTWPDRRPVWLLLGLAALGVELFSYIFFQFFLRLRPCELCVYIRFSMVAVFFGSALVALAPGKITFKIGGGLVIFWGLVQGLIWDIKLEGIYLSSGWSPCSMTRISFPLGLPLDRWLPSHFKPTALCGEDKWSLFGLNMAEWLLPVYTGLIVAYALLFGGRLLYRLVSASREPLPPLL